MRNKLIYIYIFFALMPVASYAQPVHLEEHNLASVLNPWLLTSNAAGLGLSNVRVHGVTELAYSLSKGDFHRAQEGKSLGGINFYSERFDNLSKKWTVWGSFNFTMDSENERSWSDVMNTYNNNPFIYGSSVKGDYDRQLFDFKVKISSRSINKLTYGVGIDYKVGDLSRQRDPRTRVFLADYAIIPSVTYQLSDKNFVGFNLKARYEKEKMPGITTVQDDPNLKYYTLFGMENANAIIGGYNGFQRQFVSSFLGGDFQYSLNTNNIHFVVSAGAFYQNQDILENIKQTPGSFESINYQTSITLFAKINNYLLQMKANANTKQGSADENIQELQNVNDPVTGVNSQAWVTLFTYKNQYLNNTYESNFQIDLRDLNVDENDYSWLVGLEAGLDGFENVYQLPYSSMSVDRYNAGLYGHYRFLNRKKHRITLDANVGYAAKFNSSLVLQEGAVDSPEINASTFKQGTYDVALNVILPDFEYYNASIFKFKVESTYSFPLNFKKLKMIGFAKAQFNQATNKTLGSWTGGQISIGIIP